MEAILNEPIFYLTIILVVIAGVAYLIRYMGKKQGIETDDITKPLNEASDHVGDELKDQVTKRVMGGNNHTAKVILLLLMSSLFFTSCSNFERLNTARVSVAGVEVTWELDEAEDEEAIVDTIVVASKPLYFKQKTIKDKLFKDNEQEELEFVQDGYRIWLLKTPDEWRIETQRLDTMIMIYRKK